MPLPRAQAQDSERYESTPDAKLFAALANLILETVPGDPNSEDHRQGNTMGPAFRHWRRAKIGRRFRLFFRFDSRTRIIIFAWVNDENALRSAGAKTNPYAVFQKVLKSGHPPDDWDALLKASKADWKA